jgi:6-phosphogluconate dehydrogenase
MAQLHGIGMVGLGVMGRNFVLNMADHGFSVAGYDKNPDRGQELLNEGQGKPLASAPDVPSFVAMLEKPRVIMLLVAPAAVVDVVLRDLLPHVEEGDLIIDMGNSYFRDTDRRGQLCADKKVNFFGMGISGGEAGARHGPSLMPGGPRASYERIRPVLEAVAANVDGEPCVAWMGNGSAGHYVKTVHNGIEYGLMQLIAEAYDLLHRGIGLNNDELADLFERWDRGPLASFLIEITARIFRKRDEKDPASRLLDKVRDAALQKGTGKWTSQDALDLQVPVPTIDQAVRVRELSDMTTQRSAVASVLGGPVAVHAGDRAVFIEQLGQALELGFILTYAQGLDLLRHASKAHEYGLNVAEVAKIWRGGCIIRSALLEDIRVAYATQPDLPNLIVDGRVSARVKTLLPSLRGLVRTAIDMAVPVPGLTASLGYLECLRSGSLPTNLIQAQRDYFGAHGYERVDVEPERTPSWGFHSQWGVP